MGEDEGSSKEAARVAAELRRIRESVRERALMEPGTEVLPPPRPTPGPTAPSPIADPPPAPAPRRPDNVAVNASWATLKAPPGGVRGLLTRLLLRLLGPSLEAQVAFNSRQVQLDNEILEYVDARVDATHRHYDGVLGLHGRHLAEIDERHLILQEELVAHVHDLVLGESERGRLGLESSLRDLRGRLKDLEERLPSR